MSSIKHSLRDSTIRNSKLLADKLKEREKKGAPKGKTSRKVGNSKKNKKDTEGYSETDINLSIDSKESDNLEPTLNDPVLAMDIEA